jgi:Asp-tRNA(Asn)/Glu-tRNA(Gln) amidotransferase A subunit family amidase
MNLPWTHTGLPVITLPAGLADNGLPLGLQFIAPFGADELLLSWSQMLADQLKIIRQNKD